MAHQTEIVVNGVVTEVTEFDHTAQEIDDGIDKVNTLTGEDIKTSASDETTISSQLSNALKLLTFGAGEGTDLSSLPEKPFFCMTANTGITGLPDGWPQARNDFIRFYNGNLAYTLDLLANYRNQRLAYRLATGDWYEIATATPPQMRGLTLQSGFTASGGCNFFVTQENVVVLIGGVVNSDMSSNTLTQIGTLPADACPSYIVRSVAVTDTGVGHVEVRADGTVWLNVRSMTAECWFIVAFVAGGDS